MRDTLWRYVVTYCYECSRGVIWRVRGAPGSAASGFVHTLLIVGRRLERLEHLMTKKTSVTLDGDKKRHYTRGMASPSLVKAREALENVRKSAAARKVKEKAMRFRKPLISAGAGALYEYATSKGVAFKAPIPISAEAQHAAVAAFAADRMGPGMARDAVESIAVGLAFSAGRKVVATGSIAGAPNLDTDGTPVLI